jgi:hypothetical protein
MEIVFQRGTCAPQNSKMSVVSLSDGRGGKMYVPRATYSLSRSFWTRSGELLPGDAALPGDREQEREQDRGGRVDRHRDGDGLERQALRQDPHVLDRRDRDPHLPDFTPRHRIVRVVPHLGRQIERDREARLTLLQQIPVAAVRVAGGAEPRVLPHRPVALPVHLPRSPA